MAKNEKTFAIISIEPWLLMSKEERVAYNEKKRAKGMKDLKQLMAIQKMKRSKPYCDENGNIFWGGKPSKKEKEKKND